MTGSEGEVVGVILDWIREDAPLAAKMNLMPEHVRSLADRLRVRSDVVVKRHEAGRHDEQDGNEVRQAAECIEQLYQMRSSQLSVQDFKGAAETHFAFHTKVYSAWPVLYTAILAESTTQYVAAKPASDCLLPVTQTNQSEGVLREALELALAEHENACGQFAREYMPNHWTHKASAALTQSPAAKPKRWRHKKRGTTYTEIGRGGLQSADTGGLDDCDLMVVYRSDADGSIWVRAEFEFLDGRFEEVAPSEKPLTPAEQSNR